MMDWWTVWYRKKSTCEHNNIKMPEKLQQTTLLQRQRQQDYFGEGWILQSRVIQTVYINLKTTGYIQEQERQI